MSGHALELKSGANLNLDDLPELATVEMLDACCVCIFCLDWILNDSTAVGTPHHQRRKESVNSTVKSKPLKAAQIREGEKSVVKEIKKKITPLKFHAGWENTVRVVKFAAERFPTEAAED